jgi:cysteine desulfurase
MTHCTTKSNRCIYLDYNATTPLRESVIQVMTPLLHAFGNPSSGHCFSDGPKAALEKAREQVCTSLGLNWNDNATNNNPGGVYFCSCGTEADNWAIWSAVCTHHRHHTHKESASCHVVASVIEHPAVIQFLKQLKSIGMLEYDLVRVDGQGFVDLDHLRECVRPTTCLVTIMHSNNEIGVIQNMNDIVKIVRDCCSSSCLIHSDLAQSIGRCREGILSEMMTQSLDMATIVGHKFGGPKGIAALYVTSPSVPLEPFICGGGQEFGKRSGTENVLLIAGMGDAIHHAMSCCDEQVEDMMALRNQLYRVLDEELFQKIDPDDVYFLGPFMDEKSMLPNTLSFCIRGLDSSRVIHALRDSVAFSSGSACHSSGDSESSILSLLGVPSEFHRGMCRLSVGHGLVLDDVTVAGQRIAQEILKQLS